MISILSFPCGSCHTIRLCVAFPRCSITAPVTEHLLLPSIGMAELRGEGLGSSLSVFTPCVNALQWSFTLHSVAPERGTRHEVKRFILRAGLDQGTLDISMRSLKLPFRWLLASAWHSKFAEGPDCLRFWTCTGKSSSTPRWLP